MTTTPLTIPSRRRSTPYPQQAAIAALIRDGYTDLEIGRRLYINPRVAADVRAQVAAQQPPRSAATPQDQAAAATTSRPYSAQRRRIRDDAIRALLPTMSNRRIASKLGVDKSTVARVREEAGVPRSRSRYASAEEKWAANVRRVEGGHLEWTGTRRSDRPTPAMTFRRKPVNPVVLAFRKHHGRDPVGRILPTCDFPHCMEPSHLSDRVGREEDR